MTLIDMLRPEQRQQLRRMRGRIANRECTAFVGAASAELPEHASDDPVEHLVRLVPQLLRVARCVQRRAKLRRSDTRLATDQHAPHAL